MKQPNTRTILAQLGLEPRRSTSTRVATISSMVGLGAVLGAGAVLLSRLEPVRRLFRTGAPVVGSGSEGAARQPVVSPLTRQTA
ncbi:MAG: hypothetical protein Q8N23_11415 [Archangium sp.]|nr:hypothetical protein [Archangium sp.]MDP3153273.1 hypothetical protein [Archangium sp.]MDP3569637.1 hypothetical protein [Archangium sp.]